MRRFFCIFLLLLSLAAVPVRAAGTVSVLIDGVPVAYTQSYGFPYVDGADRTQVPFRLTMETFGCTVDWNNRTRTAIASKDGITVEVPIGKRCIYVNGAEKKIDTAAVLVKDRTYLPIRAVAEAFGASVEWDGRGNRVLITTTALLRVHFIDVGQGDSALIDLGATEVLIDGGDNWAGRTVTSYIRPYVDGALDYIIATHSDADHIGGLDDVLAAYSVGEVIDSGRSASSASYRDYYQAAVNEPGCLFSWDEDRCISLGSGALLYIIETGDSWDNANDSSVVCQLVYRDIQVLFTGDISQTVERQCLSLFGDVDVLKVGHHGSATSSCAEFLSVVRPEYAVISYGVGNTYHHPTPSALKRLLNRGTTIYGTGKSGSIVMTTGGFSVSFGGAVPLTLADAGA